MALKKVSARALSQHRPVRPCDRMTPWSSARVANSAEVYWQPRPAGLDDPGPDDPAADQVLPVQLSCVFPVCPAWKTRTSTASQF